MAVFRVVLSLLCLLAFATSAAAECAWVLWEENQTTLIPQKKDPTYSAHWVYLSAYTTKDECSTVVHKRISRAGSIDVSGTKVEVTDTNIVYMRTYTPDGKLAVSQRIRYVCSPDTIDPRERAR